MVPRGAATAQNASSRCADLLGRVPRQLEALGVVDAVLRRLVAEVGGGDRLGRGGDRGLGVGVVDVHRGDVAERQRRDHVHHAAVEVVAHLRPRRRRRRPRARRADARAGVGVEQAQRRARGLEQRGVLELLDVVVDVPLAQPGRHRERGQRRGRVRAASSSARSVAEVAGRYTLMRSPIHRADPSRPMTPARARSCVAALTRADSSTSVRRAGFIMFTPITARSSASGREQADPLARRCAAVRHRQASRRVTSLRTRRSSRADGRRRAVGLDRGHRRQHEHLVDAAAWRSTSTEQIDTAPPSTYGHAVDDRRRVPRRDRARRLHRVGQRRGAHAAAGARPAPGGRSSRPNTTRRPERWSAATIHGRGAVGQRSA